MISLVVILTSFFFKDYMILDEGHKIKNPTKTTKGVHAVSARNRIILTGTPIQNNLKVSYAPLANCCVLFKHSKLKSVGL